MWPAASRVRSTVPAVVRATLVIAAKSSWLTSTSIGRQVWQSAIAAAAEAQQHRDAAFDMIADQEVVGRANGDVIVRDRRKAEKAPGARVGRDNLPNGGKR